MRLPRYHSHQKRHKKHLTAEQLKSSVLFIPRTEGGKLIAALRRSETSLEAVSLKQYKRVKFIEEGGVKLKHKLVRLNFWDPISCGKPSCTTCLGEDPSPQCVEPHQWCTQTSASSARRQGSRSRIWEKQVSPWLKGTRNTKDDSVSTSSSSHMRDHVSRCHPEPLHEVTSMFLMKKVKARSSALSRPGRTVSPSSHTR